MSLRQVLLVDDSQAILAYETAALSGLYALATAASVKEALAHIEKSKPDIVLLDLSMPEQDGDELLAILQRRDDLSLIPVVIVSSEHTRAATCLEMGATAFLPKPVRAEDLRATVARVLLEADRRAAVGAVGVLFVEVGDVEFGLPLDEVRGAVLHPFTSEEEVLGGLRCDTFDFHGTKAIVLSDTTISIGTAPKAPIVDRKLVLFERGERLFAVAVDEVRDPVLLTVTDVTTRKRSDGSIEFGVTNGRGEFVPLIDVEALLPPELGGPSHAAARPSFAPRPAPPSSPPSRSSS